MRVVTATETIELGITETTPTIGITDFSKRVTDEFGVTSVVERGFARRMSVRLGVPFEAVGTLQRRLAALRATSAQWIADDSIGWLQMEGFYKDFDIDLATPPLSYCTLSIEGLSSSALVETPTQAPQGSVKNFFGSLVTRWGIGLPLFGLTGAAEPLPDYGEDPAPPGSISTLKLLQPVMVDDAKLGSSNLPENDHPDWLSPSSYARGAKVIRQSTHRRYESLVDGNVGAAPEGDNGKWLDIGPTNRWAMFDQSLGSSTVGAGSIAVSLSPGSANALALLDVTGATARVQAGAYDQTLVIGPSGSVHFLDLPAATSAVQVTIAGPGQVSVGTLLVGTLVPLGTTEAAPTAGISDFSRKDVDEFGEVTIVERGWAKRMTVRAMLRPDAVDKVANRIAAVRAQPSLWIGDDGSEALSIYGFFKDFSIEVSETLAKLSLSVEGLGKAVPVADPTFYRPRGAWDATALDRPGDVVQHDGSSWLYIGLLPSKGNEPPELPIEQNFFWRVFARAGPKGLDGVDGTDGTDSGPGSNGQTSYVHFAYANSADGTVDFTTGSAGSRYYIGTYSDFTVADSNDPALYTWSLFRGADGANGTPGAPGANGEATYVHIAYSTSPTGATGFSTTDGAGRTYIGTYTDSTLADSNNPALYTWSLIKGEKGDQGAPGLDGRDGIDGGSSSGQTSYVHFAYANSLDGLTDFTTGAAGGRYYVGVYTDFTVADSNSPAAYSWSLFRGADGANGTPGAPGANGQATYVHIAYATAADGSTGFSTTDGAGRTYIGTYTDQTLADSNNPALYTWSLIKGADGSNGAPGAAAQTMTLSSYQVTVAADYMATVKSGQLPRTLSATMLLGSVDVSATTTWTVDSENGCSGTTIGSTGIVTINAVAANGFVRIKGVYAGKTFYATANITVQVDAAPPATATSGNTSILNLGSGFASAPTAGILTVRSTSGGGFTLGAGVTYSSPHGGATNNSNIQGKWLYRLAGSGTVFSDLTGIFSGTGATWNPNGLGPGEPTYSDGALSISTTVSGLSALTAYEIVFVSRNVGFADAVAPYGNAGVAGG